MRTRDLILAFLTVAIWGFNFVVIKVGLTGMSPLVLCAARFFFTCFPAIFFIKKPRVPFRFVALYGLIMFALQFGLLFLSLHVGMTAGLASLLLQTNVFFTALLAVFFLGERLTAWQITGMMVSFSGIGVVVMHLGGDDVTVLGFVLIIFAAACWGVGNLISKRMGKINVVSLVVWSSFIAWPPLLLAALLQEGTTSVFNQFRYLAPSAIAAIAYIVYPTTLFGFAVWNQLLKKYPVSTVAPFTLLVPVFGMLSATLALGEPLSSWELHASLCVILGLCVNLFGPRLFIKTAARVV